MKDTQEVFERLVSKSFSKASFDDVKTVTLAVWHENFVPTVEHLSSNAKKAAGYIVDKLMRFSCVSAELKAVLRELLSKLKSMVVVACCAAKRGTDKLAQQWGLDSDLKLQIRELLEFQTRHYKHNA